MSPAIPTPPSAWIGQVLKETYRIDDLIGEGGTGYVYRAFHLRLRIAVAVKILRQNAGAVAFARFRKEAEITARLRHPGIVQVLDYDVTEEGQAYLVTEWLEGETLGAFLRRRGPLPAPEAVLLLRQICDAVGAAHAAGVVHRDLKPANLFLIPAPDGGDAPVMKVLDFGIAKLTELDPVRTEQGQTLGTPRYMSPEQVRIDGGEDVGPASDQWSLGVIAYELVAGKPAFPGSAHAAMLAVLDNRPAPLPQAVPPAYREAVARAMASAPEARYPQLADLRLALDAPEQIVLPQALPLPRRLMIAGTALCVVLALLIVWVNSRRPPLLPPAVPDPPARQLVPPSPRPEDPPKITAVPLDPAALLPQVPVRIRVQPEGAQVLINGRPLHGAAARVPAGVAVRVKILPPPRSCCQGRELSYTAPLDKAAPPLHIELRCDKDCPFF